MSFFQKNNSDETKNLLGVLYIRPILYALLAFLVSTVILQFLLLHSNNLPLAVKLTVSLVPLHLCAVGVFLYKLLPALLQLGPNLVLQWRKEQPFSIKRLLIQLVQIIAAAFLMNILTTLVCLALGKELPVQDIIHLLFDSKDGTAIAIAALSAVLVAPISEELLFRLGIYASLTARLSPRSATLLTSLLFALCHGQLGVLPGLFVVGLLLQRARNTYGIRQSMLLHASYNAIQVSLLAIALYLKYQFGLA